MPRLFLAEMRRSKFLNRFFACLENAYGRGTDEPLNVCDINRLHAESPHLIGVWALLGSAGYSVYAR